LTKSTWVVVGVSTLMTVLPRAVICVGVTVIPVSVIAAPLPAVAVAVMTQHKEINGIHRYPHQRQSKHDCIQSSGVAVRPKIAALRLSSIGGKY
jgi:hypothetical protein